MCFFFHYLGLRSRQAAPDKIVLSESWILVLNPILILRPWLLKWWTPLLSLLTSSQTQLACLIVSINTYIILVKKMRCMAGAQPVDAANHRHKSGQCSFVRLLLTKQSASTFWHQDDYDISTNPLHNLYSSTNVSLKPTLRSWVFFKHDVAEMQHAGNDAVDG